jgi:streptogramin lyase
MKCKGAFGLFFSIFVFSLLNTEVCYGQLGEIITTIAGNDSAGYSGDFGPADSCRLAGPSGIFVDAGGNIFIADAGNNVIRRIDGNTGIITTAVGNGLQGYYGDGGPVDSAEFNDPIAVYVDRAGNIFIADWGNKVIRVDSAGIIKTFAGGGQGGDSVLATNTYFLSCAGVWGDDSGNIYIADTYAAKIRKVQASTGLIFTVAGNGTSGYSGDNGLADSAELGAPYGIFVDASNNIFIADANNTVRKVSGSTGIITTVAGTGMPGYTGDSSLAVNAQLNMPQGVFVDDTGNIYIADWGNNVIRKVNSASGYIYTIAGNGVQGDSGNRGLAIGARLNGPADVFIDNQGNIYIADEYNNSIRKVYPGVPFAGIENPLQPLAFQVFPNPTAGVFKLAAGNNADNLNIEIYNLFGEEVYEHHNANRETQIDISGQPEGLYLLRVFWGDKTAIAKIIVNH